MMKLLLALALATLAVAKPTAYFIRHGEKPSDGSNGLNTQGEARAQCLRKVFGAGSGYNITYIMAQAYKPSGARIRPYETVLPLATDLGIKVDISCDRDDEACVKKVITGYTGKGNILLCWEHDELTNIAQELGVSHAPQYPDDSFDLIWTIPSPYTKIASTTSEKCPGLDA